LARAGVPERVLIAAPTVAPLVVAPLLLLLLLLDRPPRRAAVAAILWVCAGTGAADVLTGLGFLTGTWQHPVAARALVIVVAAGVFCARLPLLGAIGAGVAGAALLAWPEWGDRSAGRGDALLALVVHPLPWLLLAGLALRARALPRS